MKRHRDYYRVHRGGKGRVFVRWRVLNGRGVSVSLRHAWFRMEEKGIFIYLLYRCRNCALIVIERFFFFNSESVFSKSYFLRRLFRVICTALNEF